MKKSTDYLVVALCLGLLMAAAVYVTLTSSTSDGHLSMIEPDQVLYMQYAKSIAEGQAYVFTPGDSPSTGSTTHLYPVLLALIYKLGATGSAFITASFILNTFFFLGVIYWVWLIALKMCPKLMPAALFLTAISGHTLSAVLGQTDIGFFTFLTLAMITAMLYSRTRAMMVLALICGITRPEGFIFAVAFIMCGVGALWLNRKHDEAPGTSQQARYFLIAGAAAFAGFLITLAINYVMTGQAQFMSVVNKGYFNSYPFFGALEHTLLDAGKIIKGAFFGLSTAERQFFVFPIIGGALSLCGILMHPRRTKEFQLCEIWLALCVLAVITTVASSQWQGLSNDRYMGWIMPIWQLYMLIGIECLAERIRVKRFKWVLLGLLCAYQPLSTGYFFSYAYSSGSYLEKNKGFAQQVLEEIPPQEALGSMLGGSMQYYLPEYRIFNLHGITSPAFSQPHYDSQLLRIVDLLKHHPELKFDHWFMLSTDYDANKWAHPFIGELEVQDTDSAVTTAKINCVYEAHWDAIEGGDTPVLLSAELAGKTLVDRLDVGYQSDELVHDYTDILRFKNTEIPLTLQTARLGEKVYADVGRIIMGREQFTIHDAQLGNPLFIALRTAREASGKTLFGRQSSNIKSLEMNEALELRLFIDGEEVECPPKNLNQDGFSEVLFEIPGSLVNTESPRIEIVGDHISFAYWFYQ